MASAVNHNGNSPASQAMDRAIEMAIEGNSPYPDRALFIDADAPGLDDEIARASCEGLATVVVSGDGSETILHPERYVPRHLS